MPRSDFQGVLYLPSGKHMMTNGVSRDARAACHGCILRREPTHGQRARGKQKAEERASMILPGRHAEPWILGRNHH
jgi:hypothetical protein